jgi:alkylation response protein AidB-like acyl-CoA dehydrogenase
MEFDLGDELELIQRAARGFADTHLRPNLRAFERSRSVSPEARRAFAEIGLAALELPESLGGAGLGALARAVVGEELAAGDPGAALALDPLGAALAALQELGGEAALRELALPLLERPGARALLVRESEIARGGPSAGSSVPWVPAGRADLVCVLGPEGVRVLDAGYALEPLRGAGLRAAGASALHFDGSAARARFTSAPAARRALARARLYVAGLLVGVMREAAEFSRRYALGRVAFGKPIAHHQALAFLIADMAAAVDGARLLVHEAAWRCDAGADAAAVEEAAATAFAEAAEACMFVTPNALQILGGHGFMQDYPVEKFMREARALALLLGGRDAAVEDAGQALAASKGAAELSVTAP